MSVHSLAPTAVFLVSPDATYSDLDTGAWVDSTLETLLSEDEEVFLRAQLGPSSGWSERYYFIAYELASLPMLSVVQSVRARVVLDSYSANAVVVDLQLEPFLVVGADRYLGDAQTVSGSNPSTDRQFREFDHTWSVNPATGLPFTTADLATGVIYAGFRFRCATDPAGASVNQVDTGGLVTEFELEVSGPSGANVEHVRHVASSHLLRHLEPHETLEVEVPIQYGHIGVLEPIYLASHSLPSPDGLGSGPQTALRKPYWVLSKQLQKGRKIRMTLLDAETFTASYYSPEVTDITADPQDTGIARFDMGGGWETVRAQAGYVRRPPEGLWVDRAANTPRYHKDYGLLICGGGQRWSANNTFSQGGGGDTVLGLGLGTLYTGWTFVPDVAIPWDQGSNSVVRTEELFELLFDIPGLRRAVKMHDGLQPGSADVPIYASRTWDLAADRLVRAFMKYRPDYFGPSRPKWQLIRNGTHWWIPGTGWDTTPTWNAPDQFGEPDVGPGIRNPSDTTAELPGPVWEEWWSEEIDVGASPCTLEYRVGYSTHVSGAVGGPLQQATIFGAAGLTESNVNLRCFPREFLLTTTEDLVQEADDIEINNDSDFRVWDAHRGTAIFDVTWGWRHEDLADGAIKYLLTCLHHSGGASDQVFYRRVDSVSGQLVFRRTSGPIVDEFDAVYDMAGEELPAFLRTDRIGIRWTSALGELLLPTKTSTIYFNRTRGTDVAMGWDPSQQVDGETKVLPGRRIGCLNDEYADCYFKNRRFHTRCLGDAELLRAMDY